MTTLEERAPLAFHTPTERDELRRLLAEVEEKAKALADALAGIGATLSGPPVDMLADPLAAFRLPSGAVGYETTYADHVVVGDWVQRCHGDPDWHLVTEAARYDKADDGREWVRIVHDGTANYWLASDAIRIATAPVPDPAPHRMVQP